MPMIYVKTKPNRRAYYEGRIIPQDQFIPVTDTPYIRRLIYHWEDLEVQGGSVTEQPQDQQQAPTQTRRGAPPRQAAPQATPVEARPPSRHPAAPTQAAPNTPAPGTGAPKTTN